jgi:hypothetical protein
MNFLPLMHRRHDVTLEIPNALNNQQLRWEGLLRNFGCAYFILFLSPIPMVYSVCVFHGTCVCVMSHSLMLGVVLEVPENIL